MGKAKGKQRLQDDKYYRIAKDAGYRSRASCKLLQLDSRYNFLSSARSVLDLCAAPGGWMQVAVRHAPVGSLVLGIDLDPIRPIRGAIALQSDITTTQCRAAIKRVMDSNGCTAFNVILHDGSPNVGGAWAQEATTQSALVVDSIRLATEFLRPNGTFVTKVFRSQDYSAILYCLNQLFGKVDSTKPAASRSTSAEIYVICQRYKAPAKIDPKLLDVKHLFQGAIDRPKVKDVLQPSKQKRNREGYEEGNTTLWKVGPASDFIWSETPLEFLGTFNAISFDDPESLPIKNHESTTDEVKSLCEDLYVLDKNSFKHLLKWRLRVRKALTLSSPATAKATEDQTETKKDDEEQLLNEMEELTNIMDRKKKKAKKALAKRQAKDKARKGIGMQKDATEDSYFDAELFNLSSIKGSKDLEAVETTELNEKEMDESESEEICEESGESDEESDSDEEQRRYNEQLEEMLDEAYEHYVTRKGGPTKQERKRAKRIDPNADADLLEGDEEEEDLMDTEHEPDQDQEMEEPNPLMVPLDSGKKPTQEQLMDQWFNQPLFSEPGLVGPTYMSDSEEDVDKKPKPKPKTKSENKFSEISEKKQDKNKSKSMGDDFEIVPQQPATGAKSDSDSDSDSESEEEYDNNTKAEILAYASKMLRKKQREQILDDAYNKYMFDDEGLPKWFLEEENRHRQPVKPVTREEINAMKAQFREIDARPVKKVADAKARKKRAAMKKMEKARKKADVIADQNDISEVSKKKMIDQLYRKAMPKKPQKEYVVAKKGVRVRAGKGKVLVDPRMKKDKRAKGLVKGKGKGGKGMKGKKGGKVGGGGRRNSMGGKGKKGGGKAAAMRE